jgi:hypothetical protein
MIESGVALSFGVLDPSKIDTRDFLNFAVNRFVELSSIVKKTLSPFKCFLRDRFRTKRVDSPAPARGRAAGTAAGGGGAAAGAGAGACGDSSSSRVKTSGDTAAGGRDRGGGSSSEEAREGRVMWTVCATTLTGGRDGEGSGSTGFGGGGGGLETGGGFESLESVKSIVKSAPCAEDCARIVNDTKDFLSLPIGRIYPADHRGPFIFFEDLKSLRPIEY